MEVAPVDKILEDNIRKAYKFEKDYNPQLILILWQDNKSISQKIFFNFLKFYSKFLLFIF